MGAAEVVVRRLPAKMRREGSPAAVLVATQGAAPGPSVQMLKVRFSPTPARACRARALPMQVPARAKVPPQASRAPALAQVRARGPALALALTQALALALTQALALAQVSKALARARGGPATVAALSLVPARARAGRALAAP